MRYITIALLLLVPAAADAQRPNAARKYVEEVRQRQTSQADRSRDDRARQPNGRQRDDRVRDHDRWPQTHRPRWKGQQFRRPLPFGSYYAVPSFGYGFGYFGPAAEDRYEPEPRERETIVTTGLLRLEITPATVLQYYVDGLYIGSSSNLGMEFALNAGARRVEVRAAGFKPLVFDTRIVAGEQTTFRATLEPLTQPPPAQATGNPTMFIIPGCYMGNTRPSADDLRAGCDINRLITR